MSEHVHGHATDIELTDLERNVLTLIQSGFPVCERPYAQIAQELGGKPANLTEDIVFAAVEHMRQAGAIRRIGANFDSYKLGYVSTLCAIAVPVTGGESGIEQAAEADEARIEEVAAIIDSYPGVTHDYQRANRYNLWFTLISPSKEAAEATLAQIAQKTGIDDILNLPAIHLFKVKVEFDLSAKHEADRRDLDHHDAVVPPVITPADVVPVTLTEADRELIRQLDGDISGSLEPFDVIAQAIRAAVPGGSFGSEAGSSAAAGQDSAVAPGAITADAVIARTRDLMEQRAIRRLGAAVRHGKLGFKSNIMMVWDVPDDRVMEAGRIMAGFSAVSHCYERPRTNKWRGNMYTMVHGKDAVSCAKVAYGIEKELAAASIMVDAPQMLPSTREFKKVSMHYFVE